MNLENFKKISGDVVPVLKYNSINQSDNTVLRAVSTKVEVIDNYIKFISNSLKKTLYFYNASGISAPQIGINKRIIAINATLNFTNLSEDDILVLINPEVISDTSNSAVISGMEGCLSFPESFVAVQRPRHITVRYQDLNGDELQTDFSEYQARAILHEVEHLDGKLIIDTVSPLKKELILTKQTKLINSGDINKDRVALQLVTQM